MSTQHPLTCLVTSASRASTSLSALSPTRVVLVLVLLLAAFSFLPFPPYFARNSSAREASIFWKSGFGYRKEEENICHAQ